MTKFTIRFEVNPKKALEAVMYILSKRREVNNYNILKIIYEADKFHLNTYARPVTGDAIIKMPYGTVPNFVYDLLKSDPVALAMVELDDFPFERRGHMMSAKRKFYSEYLSLSDIEALDHGINEYIDLTFSQVEKKNHQEKCWIEGTMNQPIPFEEIITNDQVIEMLTSSSLKIVI